MATHAFAIVLPALLAIGHADLPASAPQAPAPQRPAPQEPAPQRPAPKTDTPPKEQTPQPVTVGDELPASLALRDLDGKVVDLGKLRGKVVVLHFWSDSCPSEEVAEPKLNALALTFDDAQVAVLGVAANQSEIGKPPEPADFAREQDADRPYARLREKAKAAGINHPILADHGAVVGNMLKAKTTPHCFVFDAKGVLRYAGALDDNEDGAPRIAYVENAVRALLADQPVKPSVTAPYG